MFETIRMRSWVLTESTRVPINRCPSERVFDDRSWSIQMHIHRQPHGSSPHGQCVLTTRRIGTADECQSPIIDARRRVRHVGESS